MASKGKRPMRALTAADKIEAIQRVNDGESKASVARDIGVPESTLRGWCKNEDKLRYMSTRRASPDHAGASDDGEPPDKRPRTASPPEAPPSPVAATQVMPAAPPPPDAPVELTTKRAPETEAVAAPPVQQISRDRRSDPGASVSMSAISPLSGLAHLPSLVHSHLGLSFNDIATNLSLLAQLNPALSAPAASALRSVRSPKPAHNGALNLSDKHRDRERPKAHQGEAHARSRHKESAAASADDSIWYWLKTQQAMLDLQAQATKPVAPHPHPHLDYNRNASANWIWRYYKQLGGAVPPPDDKVRSAPPVPRDQPPADHILHAHLTKPRAEEAPVSPTRAPPGPGPAKARTVLDNLLFSNGGGCGSVDVPAAAEGAHLERGAAEALEHGDKFLAWLEASGDPSVTRMHLHQLRALLHNLRARRQPLGEHARRK